MIGRERRVYAQLCRGAVDPLCDKNQTKDSPNQSNPFVGDTEEESVEFSNSQRDATSDECMQRLNSEPIFCLLFPAVSFLALHFIPSLHEICHQSFQLCIQKETRSESQFDQVCPSLVCGNVCKLDIKLCY